MTPAPHQLMVDTGSLRDSNGYRVRFYCPVCAYSCWHATGFIPLTHLRPMVHWGRHENRKLAMPPCRRCGGSIGDRRSAIYCLACGPVVDAERAALRRGPSARRLGRPRRPVPA